MSGDNVRLTSSSDKKSLERPPLPLEQLLDSTAVPGIQLKFFTIKMYDKFFPHYNIIEQRFFSQKIGSFSFKIVCFIQKLRNQDFSPSKTYGVRDGKPRRKTALSDFSHTRFFLKFFK